MPLRSCAKASVELWYMTAARVISSMLFGSMHTPRYQTKFLLRATSLSAPGALPPEIIANILLTFEGVHVREQRCLIKVFDLRDENLTEGYHRLRYHK